GGGAAAPSARKGWGRRDRVTPSPWRPGPRSRARSPGPKPSGQVGEAACGQQHILAREPLLEPVPAVAKRPHTQVTAVGPEAVESHEDRQRGRLGPRARPTHSNPE